MDGAMPIWLPAGLPESNLVCLDLADDVLRVMMHSLTGWQQHTLPLGAHTLTQRFFSNNPASAYAWEMAIQTVEDAIAPMRTLIIADAALWIRQSVFAALPGALRPEQGPAQLSLTVIEAAFKSLSATAEGLPMPRNLPTESDFPARLLLLREWMHHMGFVNAWLPQPTLH
ncbi:hypothetical protein [Snodgrassella sp. CFCC 13594]|uniref:hypothetical protein n=1 Tax=Snodgrassella sp. CFCC 13594 TaxID=1775559 RepID=UPI000833D7A2|nr:hypothetical protein [Snodgrassella sp. CFCC 13594]